MNTDFSKFDEGDGKWFRYTKNDNYAKRRFFEVLRMTKC